MNMRIKTAAAFAFLAASVSAFAEVKLNENFSVSGYVVGSYKNSKSTGASSNDEYSFDAIKTAFTGTFKPVTGVVSLYYPYNDGGGKEVKLLDAYATIDVGSGFSVTAGNFLSYLGYEAFDPVNMTQMTYGAPTSGPLYAIPAYHTGARLDFGSAANSFGLAVVDSVYNGANIVRGDGEIEHNAGFEGYYKNTATKNLTLWAGFAYDTKGQRATRPNSVLTLDFWAEYKIDDKSTVALELSNYDGGDIAAKLTLPTRLAYKSKGTSWLAYYGYAFTENTSCAFRVSGTKLDDTAVKAGIGSDYIQYTVCPTYKFSKNFSMRAEYSHYNYDGGGTSRFFGVQALFKF